MRIKIKIKDHIKQEKRRRKAFVRSLLRDIFGKFFPKKHFGHFAKRMVSAL